MNSCPTLVFHRNTIAYVPPPPPSPCPPTPHPPSLPTAPAILIIDNVSTENNIGYIAGPLAAAFGVAFAISILFMM